jgi:hypothetical protein
LQSPQSPHAVRVEDVVHLATPNASLAVTSSHRIMIHRAGRVQAVAAGTLRVGDHVCCQGGVQELVEIRPLRSDEPMSSGHEIEVVQIRFHPDEAVEACLPPSDSILSKGFAWPQARRSHKKPTQQHAFCEEVTDDGFEY